MGQYTMGDILVPQSVGPLASSPEQLGKKAVGLTGEVESSLVAAAQNLSECVLVSLLVIFLYSESLFKRNMRNFGFLRDLIFYI